ncbi:ferrous iron transport protein B [soil metagenome]
MPTKTAIATPTVALIGNPNTGKSTLFGALAGSRQRVGNYPGVTVEKKLGQMTVDGQKWTIIDLPGTYSLAPRSPDEMVAVDVLLGRRQDAPEPDVVLCIVDANNLDRNLYLVSQVLELGRPTVIALTMLDVAHKRGLEIDLERLRQQLGIPVVPVQGNRRQGLEELKAALAEVVGTPAPTPESPFPAPFVEEVARLEALLSTNGPLPRYLVERLLLDTGGYLEGHVLSRGNESLRTEIQASRDRLKQQGLPVPAVEAMSRYGWVGRVSEGVVTRPSEPKADLGDRIDRFLTHRFWGSMVLLAVMMLVFTSVFTWAEAPMGWIDEGIGLLAGAIEGGMEDGPLRSLLVNGVIAGIGAVVIFLPQIFILFFFLAVLEDCGYLARAAYLMDRLMVRVGLSGKSFIPLLSSFACAIPGVMATRVIENRRDRLTTIMVAPLMSCSARLPVYTLMIAAFIPAGSFLGGLISWQALTMLSAYLLGILVAAFVALLLKRTILRGAPPPFVMELPSYKWPSPRMVLHRMFERGWAFIQRAGTIIFAVSVLMWAALYYPRISPEEVAPLVADLERLEEQLDQASTDEEQSEALANQIEAIESRIAGAQERQSFLGRAGRLIEPVVIPLGWDWRIGSAVVASFPAREVVVATLGVIFDVGSDVEEGEGNNRLTESLRDATWPDGRPLFNIPVALSIMVFFALCAQCVSTLAVIRRETNSWVWPIFSFAYMTILAYVGAFLTYQIGMLITSY